MKVKTSITISDDVLKAVDKLSGPNANRSEFIESAVRRFVEHLRRERRNAKDLEIINRRSKRLNREASDVLEYQVLT
jgi:metal-responsive CopG/Arc/MetJ family transcriptional regulator